MLALSLSHSVPIPRFHIHREGIYVFCPVLEFGWGPLANPAHIVLSRRSANHNRGTSVQVYHCTIQIVASTYGWNVKNYLSRSITIDQRPLQCIYTRDQILRSQSNEFRNVSHPIRYSWSLFFLMMHICHLSFKFIVSLTALHLNLHHLNHVNHTPHK